jgi:mRNA interferase HicA
MTGDELLRRIKRIAKERGLRYEFDQAHGKGSHGTVYLGERRTTLPYSKRELKPGTLSGVLRQLGLAKEDL